MENTQQPLVQADLDAHPELVAAGLKVGDMPIPEDQLQDYVITEADANYLALGLKVGDTIKVRKEGLVEPKLEEYRAMLDAVQVGEKVLLKGETAIADSNDPVIQGLIAAGALSLVVTAPTEPVVEAPAEVPADTAAPVSSGEPRKRYRGKIVVDEGVRTVEGRDFNHIKLEDGVELDLTPLEYDTEVKVSYPPVK